MIKYFIVTKSELLYLLFVRQNKLSGHLVFMCMTEKEADEDVERVRAQNGQALKIVIPKSFEKENKDAGPKQLSLGI